VKTYRKRQATDAAYERRSACVDIGQSPLTYLFNCVVF